ncbi:MAG: hypothetical protein R3C16_13155 [Hyphomonadaceae bacterium]
MPSDNDWQFSQPVNTPGGTVEGYEILAAAAVLLPAGLPLGLRLHRQLHQCERSSFRHPWQRPALTFPVVVVSAAGDELTNPSPESWNATLYFENDVFLGARVRRLSQRLHHPNSGRNSNASRKHRLDPQRRCGRDRTLNDHLTFTWEGLNLTDEV